MSVQEKKQKNNIAVKSGLVGIKEYLEIYNRLKCFFPHFLNAALFIFQTFGAIFEPYSQSHVIYSVENRFKQTSGYSETAITFWVKYFLPFSALLFRSGAARGNGVGSH